MSLVATLALFLALATSTLKTSFCHFLQALLKFGASVVGCMCCAGLFALCSLVENVFKILELIKVIKLVLVALC